MAQPHAGEKSWRVRILLEGDPVDVRYFTLAEAERLLPEVERLVREALAQRAEHEAAEKALKLQFQHIQLAGGSLVDRSAILSLQSRREAAARSVQRSLQAADELGVLVKDLDIGLIDFLTRYHDRDVCLCWRLGEDRISFWHSTEDGFRGRRRID
jgi:hypothetical protein